MLNYQQKKPDIPYVHPSLARPSWSFKTRGFLSPSRKEIGFIGLSCVQVDLNEVYQSFLKIFRMLSNLVTDWYLNTSTDY
jgi:hypothetical protein